MMTFNRMALAASLLLGVAFAAEAKTAAKPAANEAKAAWVCPGSDVYHVSKDCSALARCGGKVETTTVPAATGKKLVACKSCGGEASASAATKMVSVCPNSEVYHVSKDCSALAQCGGKVETMTVDAAKDKKLRVCSKCDDSAPAAATPAKAEEKKGDKKAEKKADKKKGDK